MADQRQQHTVTLGEDLRKIVDRARVQPSLEGDGEEIARSYVIEMGLKLLFGLPLEEWELEFIQEHTAIDDVVDRKTDDRGRVRLGGAEMDSRPIEQTVRIIVLAQADDVVAESEVPTDGD